MIAFFPVPTATTAASLRSGRLQRLRTGGGIGVNVRESLFHKHVDVGLHFLGGEGIERYGTTGLPDVTVHPNGTLALFADIKVSEPWSGTPPSGTSTPMAAANTRNALST